MKWYLSKFLPNSRCITSINILGNLCLYWWKISF